MENIANISLFSNLTNPEPVSNIPIHTFYENVINGEYKYEVEAIRSTTDLNKIKVLKSKLPAVTISGTFKIRKTEELIAHSKRICIDIDGKQNPSIKNWADLRTTLGSWKEVEFSALSVSGKGVFVVIPISAPKKHLEHFFALERAFKCHGIIIDSSCKDIPRLRFLSSDSGAIFNSDATPFKSFYNEQNNDYLSVKKPDYNIEYDINEAVNKILRGSVDITGSYENWFKIGCALANEYGESGRYLFHKISHLHPDYKTSECDMQFDKCLKHNSGYTKASLFWIAKNHGITLIKN